MHACEMFRWHFVFMASDSKCFTLYGCQFIGVRCSWVVHFNTQREHYSCGNWSCYQTGLLRCIVQWFHCGVRSTYRSRTICWIEWSIIPRAWITRTISCQFQLNTLVNWTAFTNIFYLHSIRLWTSNYFHMIPMQWTINSIRQLYGALMIFCC